MWLVLCELAVKGHSSTKCKPSPTAHGWYHLASETSRNTIQKTGFQTHKDMSLVLQLCINCAALNISKKKDSFITNIGEKSSNVFVTTLNRTVVVSPKNVNYKAFLFPVIKLYSHMNVHSNNFRKQKESLFKESDYSVLFNLA